MADVDAVLVHSRKPCGWLSERKQMLMNQLSFLWLSGSVVHGRCVRRGNALIVNTVIITDYEDDKATDWKEPKPKWMTRYYNALTGFAGEARVQKV